MEVGLSVKGDREPEIHKSPDYYELLHILCTYWEFSITIWLINSNNTAITNELSSNSV